MFGTDLKFCKVPRGDPPAKNFAKFRGETLGLSFAKFQSESPWPNILQSSEGRPPAKHGPTTATGKHTMLDTVSCRKPSLPGCQLRLWRFWQPAMENEKATRPILRLHVHRPRRDATKSRTLHYGCTSMPRDASRWSAWQKLLRVSGLYLFPNGQALWPCRQHH